MKKERKVENMKFMFEQHHYHSITKLAKTKSYPARTT